ncbi:hypothetical protein [Escherichia coli]|uniref:hypothetical protein n=3 Tax=Escherichia coli TaxID=562 RepID=UPI00111C9B66|nr:hypothetical protein [Escherichia coli]TNK13099.1 hypothetical protein CI673_019105 [Escherichia coli]
MINQLSLTEQFPHEEENMVFGIFSQIALGNALTKLTNVFEELEHSKRVMFPCAGGGIDSLPKKRQQEINDKMPKWIADLKKHPRHVVTRELIKNILLNQKMGALRQHRIEAQYNLLEFLIKNDLALSEEDFLKSYAD